ncbi:lipopolysaccharide assembly protein LapA domain-containing protein [Actibacterium sp. 188UL27-1]|uniref:lipopolysaccharide assembly protein LapA domain-containing protein n=1 Tax=Actibacterium sp. 188UL27-1 TaxID=2786961 RepID=UPI00195D0F27|nr:LapA family protein [Actibacterium sp. 188UL27-1]MBM7066109.1 LapA family protein [Actibacterium sp. 188UL27-1]
MRFLKYLFLAVLAICLVIIALANNRIVLLKLLPAELAFPLPYGWSDWVMNNMAIELPLYAVIFASIAVGLLVGFVWEWFREHKHRVAMRQRGKEAKTLAREVVKLKEAQGEGKDEVLAILDKSDRKAS